MQLGPYGTFVLILLWPATSSKALDCKKRQKKFTAKVNVHESLIVDFVNQDGDFVTACHSS